MKGALHERARCNGNAGSVTLGHSMHAVIQGEAASCVLYSHCAASRHHNSCPEGVRKLSRHSARLLQLYTHVFPKAAPLSAWQLSARVMMPVADGNGTAARTMQARAASARARPDRHWHLSCGSNAIPSHPQLLTANSQHPRQEIWVWVTW